MTGELPDRRTLQDHGPYSAYCKVCWRAVYALWCGAEPPSGDCIHGHAQAHDCPDAMGVAESTARIRRAKALLARNCDLETGVMPTKQQFRDLFQAGITVHSVSDATGLTVEEIHDGMAECGFLAELGYD